MKNKKLVLLLVFALVVLSLMGCQPKYTPDPAVEQFLNNGLTAEKAYDSIAVASYTEHRTIEDKQGNVKGTLSAEVQIDKTSSDNLMLQIHETFEGEYIEHNVVELTSTLQKVDGEYVYTVLTAYSNASPHESSKVLSGEDAEALVKAVVFTNNEVYDVGLYYGDLFMLRIYQYPAENFYIDEEENLCVFDAKIYIKQESTGNIKLYQTTKINELGLLVYSYEKYESVSKDNVMTCEVIPTYKYATTAV